MALDQNYLHEYVDDVVKLTVEAEQEIQRILIALTERTGMYCKSIRGSTRFSATDKKKAFCGNVLINLRPPR